MKTCGATLAGADLSGIDLNKQSVIQGVVIAEGSVDGVPNGTPITVGYARLLDKDGEFTAEVPLNGQGQFRFFAAPGKWTVRILAPGATAERVVLTVVGAAVDLTIPL